jgi:hypothetical protein
MAATATSFGDGEWGVDSLETGIIIESITHDYTNSNKTIKDRTGNTLGITYYDEQIKISLNGRIPETTPFSGTLAAALTLGNTPANHLKGGVTGGLVLIEGVTVDMAQEDYQSIKISATKYPNITA